MASKNIRPIQTFEGRGESLTDAFDNAAAKAIDANRENDGKQFVVLQHLVVVENPRIREHSIVLGATA